MDLELSPNATLPDLIQREDDHPALVVPADGTSISYADLVRAVKRLARELTAAGVQPGDAVAMTFANNPAMVICFLSIVTAGAAAAPLNPAYTTDEYASYLTDLRPRLLIRHGDVGDMAQAAADRLEIMVRRAEGQDPSRLTLSGTHGEADVPTPDPEAVALLLHTSGTTSRPKVVPLRQRHLALSARSIANFYGLGPEDVSHCVMPLFHVHGLVASTLATLASGGTVLVPPRFSATAFWADTVAHGATWFSAVPTIHGVLNARALQEPVPEHRLRFGRSCSSALPRPLQEEVEVRLRIPLLQAYGMTEAAHQMSSNPPPPGERRGGSVGCATGIEIGVLDESWAAVGPDEVGEVAVRGASIVDGYRDNPEANAASFRDGWFRTGDLGRLSPDGYLTLEGRIKEMINRAGEKISPIEVEEVLLRHPSISEAAVYARPDDKYGEQVAAAVVASAPVTEPELRDHCATALAAFKVPVAIALLREIPKWPTGKVQRRLLATQVDA